jgi:hypothetical protein
VKSNASSVQPIHAAIQAIHWSLVGSLHHGTTAVSVVADMSALPSICHDIQARPERDGQRELPHMITVSESMSARRAVRMTPLPSAPTPRTYHPGADNGLTRRPSWRSTRQREPVAQLVEHETFNLGAVGSSPTGLTNNINMLWGILERYRIKESM